MGDDGGDGDGDYGGGGGDGESIGDDGDSVWISQAVRKGRALNLAVAHLRRPDSGIRRER